MNRMKGACDWENRREDWEIRMIQYFHNEKGDIERWNAWDGVKEKYPEIVEALKQAKASEAVLNALIGSLEETGDGT